MTIQERNVAVTNGLSDKVDMKLEVVVIPVSDVDRAKSFYTGLGWRLDADVSGEGGFRVVQVTPLVRHVPSFLAVASRPRTQVPRRGSTSSSPTSRRRGPPLLRVAPK